MFNDINEGVLLGPIEMSVMSSSLGAEEQKSFGLNPVTTPFPKTYSVLQAGAIDAQENPIPTSWNMEFHEVQSHVTMTYHGNLDQVILVNKPSLGALSDGCKAAINDAIPQANKITLDSTMAQEAQAMKDFAEQGIIVVEISEPQRDTMRDVVLPPVSDFYSEGNGERCQELLKMFQDALTDS